MDVWSLFARGREGHMERHSVRERERETESE